STSYTSIGNIANGSTLWLGGGQLDPQKEYNGLLDEVHIYNQGLSPTQVQALYAAGSSVPHISGEIAHYAAEKSPNDSAGSADGTDGNTKYGPGVIGSAFNLNSNGASGDFVAVFNAPAPASLTL